MLPVKVLDQFLSGIPAELRDIVFELRNLVAEAAPGAAEEIHRRTLIYFDPRRGGHVSAGICQIRLEERHVKLAFVHGAFLPDPIHLLAGKTMPMRFVALSSFDQAPWADLKDLIYAAASFDPYSLTSEQIESTRLQDKTGETREGRA